MDWPEGGGPPEVLGTRARLKALGDAGPAMGPARG